MTFEEAKNEIKNRIRIEDIIAKDVNLKQLSSGDYIGLCPFHNDHHPSFRVRLKEQYYHCFQCHATGDVFKYLQEHDQMTFMEAMDFLCDKLGIKYEKGKNSESSKIFNDKRQKIYDMYREAGLEYYRILKSDKGKLGQEYFKKRKLDKSTIIKFGLGFAPDEKNYMYNHLKKLGFTDNEIIEDAQIAHVYNDKVYDVWQNRVMFPIFDRTNKVITFSGRDITNQDKRKYVNGYKTIIFDKSNNLFCLNYALKTKENFFIMCEGNMDCISLYQAGYTNVIAPLGTAFTENQANILARYKKQVYIAMDSDDAGVKAIRRNLPIFKRVNIDTKVIDLNPCKDPDEFVVKFGKEKFDERISNAKDSFIFDIIAMKNDYNVEEEIGKRDYIAEVIKKISSLDNQYVIDIYTKSVANEIGIDEKKLEQYIDEYKRTTKDNVKKVIEKDEYAFENVKIEEKKEVIDKNELLFIEILTDNMYLIDTIKKYISVEDINNEICRSIYSDICNGLTIIDLINKYSNVEVEKSGNDDGINNKLVSDIIATSVDMDEVTIKKTMSTLIKKMKINKLQNEIQLYKSDGNKTMELLKKLKETKNNNFIID